MQVYNQITTNTAQGKKMLAVLLDPEKTQDIAYVATQINGSDTDMVLVGGSGYLKPVDEFVGTLKSVLRKDLPVILFPGDVCQFSDKADAILFLSLLNSKDSELLAGRHIRAARSIHASGIEVIPMAYILVDGGKETTVQQVTHAEPLRHREEIAATALAGEMLGKRMVYLEAGSGADIPVATDVIAATKQLLSVPLIVGGGICTTEQMKAAFGAGADIVVIGNHFEKAPEDIKRFAEAKQS